MFIHSVLCDFRTKRYEIRLAKEPFFVAIAVSVSAMQPFF